MNTIAFIETEPAEQAFLEEALAGQDLHFCAHLAEIESRRPHILSVFINSAIDAEFLDQHPQLLLIVTRSTAAEHIDLVECGRRNILVSNVPNYGDYTVAEHVFALILGLSRRLREAMAIHKNATFSYERIRGFELHGKTIGVVGAGRIGQKVAQIAKAFALEVLVYDLAPRADLALTLGFTFVPLDELLARSHVISLHVPLTAETYHLLNRAAFAKCRPGVLVINTARGRLIDSTALIEALDAGIVAGAGLDVLEEERVMRRQTSEIIGEQIRARMHASAAADPALDEARFRELQALLRDHQLIERPNVLFTPHVAFNSVEAIERILQTTLQNIAAFRAGTPINLVVAGQECPEAGVARA